MKIDRVVANNRRKVFDVYVNGAVLSFPYSKLDCSTASGNLVSEVYVDPELGREGFTCVLRDGSEDSVHVDAVLDYNSDAEYLKDLLLYKLSLAAQKAVTESSLSKREIIRRLGTSASQFYRLLDQTNYRKSIGQMVQLLSILDCDVDLVVRKINRRTA